MHWLVALISTIVGTGAAIGSFVATKFTWRRVLLVGLFGVAILTAGGIIQGLSSTFLTTFRSLSGVNIAITLPSYLNLSNYIHLPTHISRVLFSAGVDWFVWLALSYGNLYLLQSVFRRAVRWAVSVIAAIYNNV